MLVEVALARGFLAPVDYRLVVDDICDHKILETPAGNLSLGELNRKLFLPRRDKEIIRIIRERTQEIEHPQVIIFCPSIAYCEYLATYLAGAVPIHSGLPEREQQIRLAGFREGTVSTVLTVDKLNEGIDVPKANVIVFLRSTSSRMIFLQQLGRGLRKAAGKERVLVLDFVANCERLQMVHALWQGVHELHQNQSAPTQSTTAVATELMSVDVGSPKFTESVRQILDVLAAIRNGYTKEMLISQLQKLREELGRVPMVPDVAAASKEGKCVSPHSLATAFGSFNAALEAAGLPLNMKMGYTRDELILQLQELAHKLGRTPKRDEITAACKRRECASAPVFSRCFGSWNRVLEAADLKPLPKGYTAEELIEPLKDLHKELGRVPRTRDVHKASIVGKCPSASAFYSVFGSLPHALKAAGITPTAYRTYERSQLIEQLQQLGRELGRVPMSTDIIKRRARLKQDASASVFYRMFGSFNKALEAAGFPIRNRKDNLRVTKIAPLIQHDAGVAK